ncbi:hypothetical protein EDC65_1528 [Stella humosa]|uniref:Uncharacterized protein n=1 Tax=Stella humosa TaxID=94 RepID=A0A3N1M7P5_9PROT|nr:hypothetical protein [Stella humosa]ROP99742.1 hypothetical protein EDC65_1528 [Stella humosa]BBK31031.1 hypothetical protein STHU_16650 [Stella humosa]
MPLVLRHLMPLIVIGTLFVISLVFTLVLLSALGLLFARKRDRLARGPVIEGNAAVIPDEPALREETPGAGQPPRAAGNGH